MIGQSLNISTHFIYKKFWKIYKITVYNIPYTHFKKNNDIYIHKINFRAQSKRKTIP